MEMLLSLCFFSVMEGFRFRKLESGGNDTLVMDHTPSAHLNNANIIIHDGLAVNAAAAVRRPLSHPDQNGTVCL